MKKERGADKKRFHSVGVDPNTVPDEGDPGNESTWWVTAAAKPQGTDSAERKATSTEEMENFRPVPVLGKLPWNTQYLVASGVLVVSLLLLLVFALRSNAPSTPISFASHFSVVSSQVKKAQTGEALPEFYPRAVQAASAASATLPAASQEEWKKITPALNALPEKTASIQQTQAAAKAVRDALIQSLNTAAPLWRQAGEGGEWSSVEAVNFAQVLSETQYLQDVASRVVEGSGVIPDRAATARQNIEQAFRVYAASPAASQNTPLSQAWRALAAGFGPSRPHLDTLVGNRTQWNSTVGLVKALDGLQKTLPLPSASSDAAPSSAPILILALLVVVSGGFLFWIGWKQQRWRVLEAQSVGEQLRASIDDFGEHLKDLAKGDLTVALSTDKIDPALKPMSKLFNSMVRNLHKLTGEVKSTAGKTAAAAKTATAATEHLVESAHHHLQFAAENGEDILQLSTTLQELSNISDESGSLAQNAAKTLEIGQEALLLFTECTEVIKGNTEQGVLRATRLQKSISEVLFVSTFMSEVAQQISVLAIQAAIQASKAGDAGQGFRVVADGLKVLAEKSNESATRVGSLVEATVLDIQAMEEIFETVKAKAEEAAQSSEVSSESLLMVRENFHQLQEMVQAMKETTQTQKETAERLSEMTRLNMEQIEQTSERATAAAAAVGDLVRESSLLDQSAHKFKMKD